jgi:gamma-glutamylcyclotransferase (GGCT)/AIG2-like uncharacterized protein YtfP
MSTPIRHVFVYGTLQQGKERSHFWPHPPCQVRRAWTQGSLYDLGPYPALLPGVERVEGELWELNAGHVADTLRVLDEVEGYNQAQPDWYRRDIVLCYQDGDRPLQAFAYLYCGQVAPHQRVPPDSRGICVWNSSRNGWSVHPGDGYAEPA